MAMSFVGTEEIAKEQLERVYLRIAEKLDHLVGTEEIAKEQLEPGKLFAVGRQHYPSRNRRNCERAIGTRSYDPAITMPL